MIHSFESILKDGVKFVDFRFSDVNGVSHHITRNVESLSDEALKEGIFFDGSSIKGLKPIEDSDMLLVPDLSTYFIDPFTAQPTGVFICNIIDPSTSKLYYNDCRSIAIRATSFLQSSQIADVVYFGPELEFFVFDKVKIQLRSTSSQVELTSQEIDDEELGYTIRKKMGYMPTPPLDTLNDIRSEMLSVMEAVGISSIVHHHEVASSQCEIGFKYADLLKSADNTQKAKNIIRNVAYSYGKSVTFMPKPMKGDNGSGMHCHQSLWKNGQNLFVEENGLMSKSCKYYIGGILKHIKAINAISNPSINSYKRLVPGYEAPTVASYASGNRSACIRIPKITTKNAFRIEARFPDMLSNPYMIFSALLMAGIDGILNKIDPGEPLSTNSYNLPKAELINTKMVSSSLSESLNSLNTDREFLKVGGVFSDDLIDMYIGIRNEEISSIDEFISPAEFAFYYNR